MTSNPFQRRLMTKRERVAAALQGQEVDRAPISFWGHDYLREGTAQGLAQAMLERHFQHDWDYMKLNPRASYYAEDWGAAFTPSSDPHRSPELSDYPLKQPQDWERLPALDVRLGAYGQQLEALRLVKGGLTQDDAPVVQTVFSPLSVARYLVGGEEVVQHHMAEAPWSLHVGLAVITQTLVNYAQACLEAGADGIFFATTAWATHDRLTADQYREFGRPYDLQVLAAVQGAFFNILHVCRDRNMLDILLDYPVSAINWAATLPGNATLAQGQAKTTKAVMGGVGEATLLEGTPEAVAAEVRTALESTGGRLLLAAGCSISPAVPAVNLRAAREAVLAWRQERTR